MTSSANLQTRTTIIASGILLFVIAINTIALAFVASRNYREAVLARHAAVGESLQRELSKVLAPGMSAGSKEGVNAMLSELVAGDKSLGYALVTDKEGMVLFHSDRKELGKKLRDEASVKAASSPLALVQTAGSTYDFSFPLRSAQGTLMGTVRIGVEKKAVDSRLHGLYMPALAVSSLSFVLAAALFYGFISRGITKPLMAVEQAAGRIASGDLSAVDITAGDALPALSEAVGRIALTAREMVVSARKITRSVVFAADNMAASSQGVLSAADAQTRAIERTASSLGVMEASIAKVAASSETLSDSAADTASSIAELTASIETIAENSNVFSETANETASSIEEMVSTIKEIAGSLETLAGSAEAIAASIEEVSATTLDIERGAGESVKLAEAVMVDASEKGMKASSAAMKGMENIKESVSSLSEIINTLGKRANDIGKIVNVIDDVADQTNMLAINAAILASKAGEHGKGFAVVADEIKSLAERTSFSTSEIAALVKSVQDDTMASIKMAGEGIQTVDKGLILVADVSNALQEIVASSGKSTDMAKAIQRATAEETQVIKQITSAVESMTAQTENISRAIKEQGRGSRLIIEATEKVKEIAHQVKTSTAEQRSGSRQIAGVIDSVTQQASWIANATALQKEKRMDMAHSVEEISAAATNLTDSAHDMNAVITSLKKEAEGLLAEIGKFKV